jgi:hypothetical protein
MWTYVAHQPPCQGTKNSLRPRYTTGLPKLHANPAHEANCNQKRSAQGWQTRSALVVMLAIRGTSHLRLRGGDFPAPPIPKDELPSRVVGVLGNAAPVPSCSSALCTAGCAVRRVGPHHAVVFCREYSGPFSGANMLKWWMEAPQLSGMAHGWKVPVDTWRSCQRVPFLPSTASGD